MDQLRRKTFAPTPRPPRTDVCHCAHLRGRRPCRGLGDVDAFTRTGFDFFRGGARPDSVCKRGLLRSPRRRGARSPTSTRRPQPSRRSRMLQDTRLPLRLPVLAGGSGSRCAAGMKTKQAGVRQPRCISCHTRHCAGSAGTSPCRRNRTRSSRLGAVG
jgi:hypothetical protein